MCNFADGFGGSLFYGVDNDGVVKGLNDIQAVGEAISQAIRDKTDPLANHFIHRDYTVMGGEVHIDIYDGPVGLYGKARQWTEEDLQ